MVEQSSGKLGLMKKFWIAVILMFLLVAGFFGSIALGYYGPPLPSTEQLENPKQPVASEVISSDGVILGKFFEANRVPVDFEDLSPALVNALISTEDVRFYSHSGVDFKRAITIIPYNLIGKRQGASTISQQLAKNLFPRKKLSKWQFLIRKLQEWVLATRLEKLYTKEEILAMYLNTAEFGNGAYGIKSAANTYFNKSTDKITEVEAALLVGILKAPGNYDPNKNPARARIRRNTVLALMRKNGAITDKQFVDFSTSNLNLNFKVENHNEGTATYFREYIRNNLKTWATENGYDIYRDGLKIYTTIDSRMQKYAEEAVLKHMKDLQKVFYAEFKGSKLTPWHTDPEIITRAIKQSDRYARLKGNMDDDQINKIFKKQVHMKVFSYRGEIDTVMSPLDSIKYYKYFLHTGFVAMEPNSGNVKLWVGGVNFKYFKYDHCAPYAKRQVGSTFKPFVYAAGVNAGYSPCTKVANVPVVFEEYDNWSPKNSEDMFDGQMMTLAKGLATSTNRITAWLMKSITPAPVISLARSCGINSKLDAVPSLCLGVADLSLYEMLPAYNTFNNMGTYVAPVLITHITDKNGRELKRYVPVKRVVLDERKDYVVLNLLKGVTNGHLYGTASRLRYRYGLKGPMAGKTGTTQSNADGWFMGLVPQLTGGIWVGCDEPAIHFNNMAYGMGAGSALPIWAYFMQKVYDDKKLGIDPNRDWVRPNGDIMEMDCDKFEDNKQTEDPSNISNIINH